MKNQVQNFVVGKLTCFTFFYYSRTNCALQKFFAIDSLPIIRNFEDNLIALMIGVQSNCAAYWLTGCEPKIRGFNAMIRTIANEVRERFRKSVKNALVHVSGLAGHFKNNFLLLK